MSSLFNDLSDELFQILKGSGKQLTLYDIKGNRTYEPTLARRVFVEPDKMMVSVHEAGSDSEVAMYLSDSTDINDMAQLINTMRQIATRYNVLLNVRKFDHTLRPKDFAYQVEPVAEAAMFGSTKTSYQRIGETKLIVRHARPVNADITGSRSRNILNLFVETKQGERFRFPVRHLSGARAFAQHINQGGTPYDVTGLRICELAQESSALSKVSRYIQYAKSNLHEEATIVRSKVRERLSAIRSTLQSLSRPRGYKTMIESKTLNQPINLQEDNARISAEVDRLASLLKINPTHALAESLLPVALLNLGEIAMNNINEMFYEGLSVPADLMQALSEALANEYGYMEGSDWSYVDKGTHRAIYFENGTAHADACDLLENILGCGFLAEDVEDKFLTYATNWVIARNQAMGAGDVVQKDQTKTIEDLAAGLKAVLVGQPVARPKFPAEMPKFTDEASKQAYTLSLFLDPKAGLKNDALFNYISIIVDKLQSGQKLSAVENHIVHALDDQVVGESIDEEEIFEATEDGVLKYASSWVQKRHGAVDSDIGLNKREEERDMEKASVELADGLRDVFTGKKIANARYPAPSETPTFTNVNSQFAYELGLFLEPEAGLKNDALFTYISVLVQKLVNGEKLTGPEKMIMDRILDTLDDSAHVGADENIEEGSFDDYHTDHSSSFDGFIEHFVHEFDPADMFAATGEDFNDITPETASEYYLDATLVDKDIDNLKQSIGWYASRCWQGSEDGERLKDLTHEDEQQIIKAVWPKVVKYLGDHGLKLAEGLNNSVNEAAGRRTFEFRSVLDDGVETCPVICTVEVDGEEHGPDAIANITSVKAIESQSELLDVLHPDQLSRLESEADEEMRGDMAERGAEYAGHLRDMEEDAPLAVHPAFETGQHIATDFGPGCIVDSVPGGFKVELQNGDVVDVSAEDIEPVTERMREEAELDVWFEDFDPAAVLAPLALDEYQLDKDDARLTTDDRVVHKAYGPGTVKDVNDKFARVEFDRPHQRLPNDRTVSLMPGTLYKATGNIFKNKVPAPQPGDKIRRQGWQPSGTVTEEVNSLLGQICDEGTLQKILQELGQYANQIITDPSSYNLPDPHNLHYDDTNEEAYEFVNRFKQLLMGKLDDLLDDAHHGLIEAEDLDELSKHYIASYFDHAAQGRGALEKAEDDGDEKASRKLSKRDHSLDVAWRKMHESTVKVDHIGNGAGEQLSQTRFRGNFEGNPQDFCNAVFVQFGDKVYEQAYAILMDDEPFEEQNENALKYIKEIADERGETEFASALHDYLTAPMEEQGEETGLVLPGDAGDALIADVKHNVPTPGGGDGEYTVYGKTFKTKTFDSDNEANKWLEANPEWGVIGTKDHKVHVAHKDDELEEALGMERILKLSGQRN